MTATVTRQHAGHWSSRQPEATETAYAEPLLMQDENSGKEGRRYNEWLSSRPDARLRVREAADAIGALYEEPLALPKTKPERRMHGAVWSAIFVSMLLMAVAIGAGVIHLLRN